jgi:hypothetical protein
MAGGNGLYTLGGVGGGGGLFGSSNMGYVESRD